MKSIIAYYQSPDHKMKSRYFSLKSGIVLLFSLVVFTSFKEPPCDSDAFLNNCSPSLEDFVFMKSFPVELTKPNDKMEYSYVFSRGSTYRIVICDQNEQGNRMIVNLLDRNKKLIASNYLKSSKKFFPSINCACAATGVYYVEVFFEGEKKGCGVNILGFRK